MTSIVGPVVNYTILNYLFYEDSVVSDYRVMVYGDDAPVGFNAAKPVHGWSARRGFLKRMKRRARAVFGLTLSEVETEVTLFSEMSYYMVQPRFPECEARLLEGTRRLRPRRERRTTAWEFSADYSHGFTHRG